MNELDFVYTSVTCPMCEGTGEVEYIVCLNGRHMSQTMQCDTCRGDGKVLVQVIVNTGERKES